MSYVEYFAHLKGDNLSEYQTVEAHLDGVARRIDQFFIDDREKPIPELNRLAKIARVAAKLHDVGKYSEKFQEYIKSEDETFKRRMRGKIDHSTAVDNTFSCAQMIDTYIFTATITGR